MRVTPRSRQIFAKTWTSPYRSSESRAEAACPVPPLCEHSGAGGGAFRRGAGEGPGGDAAVAVPGRHAGEVGGRGKGGRGGGEGGGGEQAHFMLNNWFPFFSGPLVAENVRGRGQGSREGPLAVEDVLKGQEAVESPDNVTSYNGFSARCSNAIRKFLPLSYEWVFVCSSCPRVD